MGRRHRWRASLVMLVAALWSTSESWSFAEPPAQATFRTGVDLVHLHVVATDGKGRRITGLDKAAFVIFEDRAPQELEFFTGENVPLDLAVLLDTSMSMSTYMLQVREAALGLVRSLRPGDRASIVEFNDVVRVRADFTEEISTLESAIRDTAMGRNTALYTGVYVALKSFPERTREALEVRRQALVVLSDGFDTGSLVDFDDLLELAQQRGVSVYTISLTSDVADPPLGTANRQTLQASYQMRALAIETGARAFLNKQISELAGVYGDIIDELSQQYTIGYTSSNPLRDGTFRRVQVQIVAPAGVRAHTRSGYFASRETPLAQRSSR